MNILPLVFTFLIIFSCIAFTFLREVKSFSLIETTLDGYHRTQRAVNNAMASKAYRRVKANPLEKKQDQRTLVSMGEYASRRIFFPPLENSKFNLCPLFKTETDAKLHPLYEPLANLLRLLYQNSLFAEDQKQDKLEYRLIDAMIKKARKVGEVSHLSQLCPDDGGLKKLYYQMLKGTNQYSAEQGIPPLGDFLSINKGGKAVCISFASPLVLNALFGPAITDEIMKIEQENAKSANKYYYFSKEDMTALLMKSLDKASLFTTLEEHLDYSKQFAPKTIIGGRDKLTGIAVKTTL